MRSESTGSRARRYGVPLLLSLAAAMLAPSAPARAASLSGVAVAEDAIILSFDEAVAGARAFLLANPPRVAVDLDGVTPAIFTASGGPVTQTRVGTPRPGTARVVFDLASPTALRAARLSEDGRSLTLDIAGASDRAFAAAVRARPLSASFSGAGFTRVAMTQEGTPAAGVTMPLDAPEPYRLPMPAVQGRADKPLVVIDAGHGGHDPGSLSVDGRYREKDAALAIARAVRDELLASGRVRVAMTRSDDRFLVLRERREIARRLKADLFISVHCDSAPGSSASGATIYTLSEVSSDRVAAQLAAKENKSDVLNGVDLGGQSNDVSSILIDLTQRETMNTSSRFADLLQRELTDQGVSFKTTYHRFAGLAVLKAPDVPAVLLETGYITDPGDLRLLFSRAYQKRVAVGVTHAIEAHFARRLGKVDIASAE